MARKPSPKTSKPSKTVQSVTPGESRPIKEDLPYQQLTWMVERGGWAVMALIVIAALSGVFGGLTTREEVRDGSGRLLVSYQDFQRHLDPTSVQLTVDTRGQSLFEVTIDEALASKMDIRTIMPTPIEVQAHDGGLLLKFAASPESERPALIAITGVPTRWGRVRGRIGLIGESSAAQLDIFVYP